MNQSINFHIRSSVQPDQRRIKFEIKEYPFAIARGDKVNLGTMSNTNRYAIEADVTHIIHNVFPNLGTVSMDCYLQLDFRDFDSVHEVIQRWGETLANRWSLYTIQS